VTGQARTASAPPRATEKPLLLFFSSPRSGRCRRTEGFLAQVLQRRQNHETFRVHQIPYEERPDLADRFRVREVPTLLVVDRRAVRGRLVAPRGCEDIQAFLAPWLR
jgi:thioredoxin-like negative regulator of GroEL